MKEVHLPTHWEAHQFLNEQEWVLSDTRPSSYYSLFVSHIKIVSKWSTQ